MVTTGDQLNPNLSPPSPVPLLEQTENQPNWLDLPRDLTCKILLKLGAVEILLSAQTVCSQWRSICMDPFMWRTIDMLNLDDYIELGYDLNKFCRMVVDRSSGDLYSISIDQFLDNETLEHITDRCKNIRCLRLVSCHGVSDEGLCKAVKRLPYLEELDLTNCLFSAETMKSVGISFTYLKSFKLNNPYYKSPAKSDAAALAIAKSMHQLHHLQLFGSKMTNEGLKAVLDGCPHLESLDLRQCVNVNLEGSLGKRCANTIKDLRLPYDPTNDYQYNSIPYGNNSDEDSQDDSIYEEISEDDEEYYLSEYSDGHIEDYYEEYGDFSVFPDGYEDYNDNAFSVSRDDYDEYNDNASIFSYWDVNDAICLHCGKKGHWKENCIHFNRKMSREGNSSGF